MTVGLCLTWFSIQGVITINSPVEPFATGIKMKSSDQEVNFH